MPDYYITHNEIFLPSFVIYGLLSELLLVQFCHLDRCNINKCSKKPSEFAIPLVWIDGLDHPSLPWSLDLRIVVLANTELATTSLL